MTLVVFVLILFSAVLVHEFAHYLAARSVNVPVHAFSIGMGPILARWRWRGTEWRLSALPLGGYVHLPGMAPEVGEDGELRHPDDGMAKKSLGAKVWVLSGGVLANFALGVLLLTSAVLLQPGYRMVTSGDAPTVHGTEIVEVVDGSVAERLGLQAGDRLVAIEGVEEPVPDEAVEAIGDAGPELTLTVLRNGERQQFRTAWPPQDAPQGERPMLGVQLGPASVERVGALTALGESAVFGVQAVPQMVVGFVRGFAGALSGSESEEVAGPVGMVGLVNQAASVGVAPVLLLAAIINFSLAVFNVLPIPGLDGGRILLASVVAARGRPFAPGQEETFHFLGIMAVLGLIVLITFQELRALLVG